ncbi:uncharacterized protein PV09_09800 [Verruconis gallopava]|uniref:CCHC-type domain-containing protein n=1 Tax=Verruconis gallopava TaxID=253628 RepID=A0A0D1X8L9_9PEZI|nr:uncharacterized protein PV09_09800 [Verruconis gallopava]KIV98360.1 hypothetical protein PV09_09800 [Verruconis gallopava]
MKHNNTAPPNAAGRHGDALVHEVTGLTNLRERVLEITKQLSDTLHVVERDKEIDRKQLSKALKSALLALAKIKDTPDVATLEEKANTQAAATAGKEAKTAAIEAVDIGRTVLRSKGTQQQQAMASYAAVAAQGAMATSIYSPQNTRPPAQTHREIIMNIRNAQTILHLRAMNPRNLKAHVKQAIAQGGVTNAKVIQSAQEWVTRIGNGMSIRRQTYGVLIHSVYTKDVDMDRLDEINAAILSENKPFIPTAEIKYIGWLSRKAQTKRMSTLVIEFTKPEDANKIIDEGLTWQGCHHDTERYERQCRLKQCFNCQKYGHIGTQCKARTACGHCAQEHNSRDCPSKADTPKKCAGCNGPHESWNRHCKIRKEQLTRTKAAYDNRPKYHPVLETPKPVAQVGNPITGMKRQRLTRDLTASQAGRASKQTNTGLASGEENKENESAASSQRPQRVIQPSRKALEA